MEVQWFRGVWKSSGCEAGSYLRRIDSRITELKAEGPSRTCNESKEEEEEGSDNQAREWESILALPQSRCLPIPSLTSSASLLLSSLELSDTSVYEP